MGAANAAVEALAGKGGQLNFGHIEPGTALGRAMKREPMAQVAGRFNGQVFLKDAVGGGAVVVLHQLILGALG